MGGVTALRGGRRAYKAVSKLTPVAALCVSASSVYHKLEGVEAYDKARDVRTFRGGMPVVAHPPCRAWSAYCSHQAKPEPGERDLAHRCATWLIRCGGVLENPAHSRLFHATGLPWPEPFASPSNRHLFTIEVEQCWWGFPTRKRTWLCFSGVDYADVWKMLPFRLMPTQDGPCGRFASMSAHQRSHTTPEFAQWLVSMARMRTPYPVC